MIQTFEDINQLKAENKVSFFFFFSAQNKNKTSHSLKCSCSVHGNVSAVPDSASVLPSLSELQLELGFWRVLGALQPVVGGSDRVEPAPVPLAQDPGQDVHLVVQLGGELGADQVRRSRPFPPRDQSHAVVVATVLLRQHGAVVGQHGADAEAGRGLVDVEPLLGAAGVPPAVRLAEPGVLDVDGAVDHLGGVGAGAAGQLGEHLVQVLLQEVIPAA